MAESTQHAPDTRIDRRPRPPGEPCEILQSLGQPSGAIAVLRGLPQNGYLAALSDDGPIDLPARAHETVQLRRRKPARLCIQHRKRRAAHVELVGKPRRYGGAAATSPSAVANAQREVLVQSGKEDGDAVAMARMAPKGTGEQR